MSWPFGVLADALHVPVGVPITARSIFYSGGHSGLVTSIVTGDALYRVLDKPLQTIDGGLGFRWWSQSVDTILNGRLLTTTSISEMPQIDIITGKPQVDARPASAHLAHKILSTGIPKNCG